MIRSLIVALSIVGCDAIEGRTVPDEYKLADPNCKSYVAIPGEPCRDGLYLDVPYRPRGTPLATCQCYLLPVEKNR